MTEQIQKHIDPLDGRLSINLHGRKPDTIVIWASMPHGKIRRGNRSGAIVEVPVIKLLAMIDLTDPEAMRGYLRERADYLDSPHDHPSIAVAGNGPAAEHFDYLDAVPEVDSPEDIDEHPDAGSRLYALQQVAAILPRDALVEDLLTAAAWVHSGTGLATIEDHNMAGEVVS